jgi:hypothetical protein
MSLNYFRGRCVINIFPVIGSTWFEVVNHQNKQPRAEFGSLWNS